MDLFPRGAIVRIELRNFMTYEHVIQTPGPKINFILGRNGSGKSSIVCAIALCCGSTPSFIGRAQHLADFIKHGTNTASAELHLSNPGGEPIKIRRVIHRNRGGNECFFNGEKVMLEAYLEKIKELHIMTDNLVQFLPQERVIDFSLMSPIQLLENTEKTIGNINLSTLHEELKKAGTNWGEAGAELDRLRRDLDDAKDKEAQLKHEVEAMSIREGILTAITLVAVKRDRLALIEQQANLSISKKALQKVSEELHASAVKILPFQEKIAKGRTTYGTATGAIVHAKRTIEATVNAFRPEMYATEPDTVQHENLADHASLTAMKKSFQDRQSKIEQHKLAKANLQAQTAQMDVQEIKESIADKVQEQKSLRDRMDKLMQEKQAQLMKRRHVEDDVQSKTAELQKLEQADDERFKFLRSQNDNALRAKIWLRENKERCKGKVYGPLIMEFNIKDKIPRHANIIESLISRDMHYTFICEEEEDVDLLMSELIEKQKLRFPIKKVAPVNRRHSTWTDPDLLRRKVNCKLLASDLIEAPETVFRFLCNRFKLSNVPVYDKLDEALISRYKQAISGVGSGFLAAPVMIAGDQTFKFRRTRFGSNLGTTNQPIRPAAVLDKVMNLRIGKPDTAPLRAELARLQEKAQAFKAAEEAIQVEAVAVHENYTAISKEVGQSKTAIMETERHLRRIAELEKEIQKLEAVVVDFDGEKRKIAAKVKRRNIESLKKLLVNQDLKKQSDHLLKDATATSLGFVRTMHEMQKQSKTLRVDLQKMSLHWEKLRSGILRHNRVMDSLKANLNEHVALIENIPGASNAKLPTEALEQYVALPGDTDQLEAMGKAKRAQLNAAGDINVNARRDLDRHISAIKRLENDIATRNGEIQNEKERMARQRQKWIETIQNLVDKIGSSFSEFYKSMGLAGDVLLMRPPNPDKFDEYGFGIKVSYRPNRSMEQLSGQRHSGGEKSVATALYMLAIQELTKCPFRVVDEINQGMDAENERRVFKMIVETASRCGGQYFILSPKLLPDLHLTKDVTVTVILAGNEMHSGNRIEEWNLHNITKAICQRSKRLKLAVPTEVTSIGNGSKLRSTRKRQITADEEDDADTSVMGHHAGLATSVKGNPRPEKRHRKLAAVN